MAQVNTSTSWPPAGLADGGAGVSTGYPKAPLPDVANNLKMVVNAIDSVAPAGGAEVLTTAELQATATPTPAGSGFASVAADLEYKWISGTLQGVSTLKLVAATLAIGGTFLQSELDGGSVNWTPDAVGQSDALVFQVKDKQHGGIIPITITFPSA